MTDLLRQAREAYAKAEFDRSAELCQIVLASYPNEPEALLIFGISSAKMNRVALSIQALQLVLDQNPNVFDALVWLGIMEHQQGNFDNARVHLKRAIALDPNSFAPYVGILRGHKAKEEDRAFLLEATQLLASKGVEDDETRQMIYAVAKAYDDLGEYATAIEYYDRANELAGRLQRPNGPNRQAHKAQLDAMSRVFSTPLLSRPPEFANSTQKPIFILGMIRSGTTLVEQIVSRHPEVSPGGELRFWLDKGRLTLLPGASGFNAELGEYLSLEYVASLNRVAPGDVRVTDKMPLNYMMVGLIHHLFPNAPIIHCRRNPADTCLSIYMTPYAAPPDFAYDREEIAFAYQEYRRLMRHWAKVLPMGRILEVEYENLVSRPEPNIRKIIDYCGLKWNEACLSPEENDRIVDTPSKWQVRQPVYSTSVGRSQNYAPWLGAIGNLS